MPALCAEPRSELLLNRGAFRDLQARGWLEEGVSTKTHHQCVAQDGSTLKWEHFAPQATTQGYVLIVPGLTSRNHEEYRCVYDDLGQAIAELGYECVTLAVRGQLGSEGEYSFPNAVEDVATVIDAWLTGRPESVALFARSSGGPIALRVAREIKPLIRKILLWGVSPRHVYDRLFGSTSDGSYMRACIEYGSRMSENFMSTLFFPEDEIVHVECPVWLGLGIEDTYSTATDQLALLNLSAPKGSLFFTLPACQHSVTSRSTAWPAYWSMLKAWLEFSP